jgi:catechol 2,3-dioxygenase-like lactoylglutathione lyase family enzyme
VPGSDHYATAVLDHVRIMVGNLDAGRAFYERALEPLGYRVWHDSVPGLIGLGPADATEEPLARFWLRQGEGSSAGTLVSFTVASRELVEVFHRTALAAGGADGGAPSPRPFHAHYFSAFVIDPDGVTLEAVCHRPA